MNSYFQSIYLGYCCVDMLRGENMEVINTCGKDELKCVFFCLTWNIEDNNNCKAWNWMSSQETMAGKVIGPKVDSTIVVLLNGDGINCF